MSEGEVRTTAGGTVRYKTVTGETYIKSATGEPIGSMFSTTYLAKDGKKDRPVAFIFNGGPGSASQWLHMGAFGPRLVVVPTPEDDGAPPYDVRDNPHTLLDVADLVFIDPISTGYSRPLKGSDPEKDFWGPNEDAASVAEFIRVWLAENKRWGAPKYIMGESYGTVRTALLVKELEGSMNDIPINGIVLMSTLINRNLEAGELRHVALLPSFAATAWYHGQIETSRWNDNKDAFLDEVRSFALKEYAPALLQGQLIDATTRNNVVSKLSTYTGLDRAYVDREDFRITGEEFRAELLRDENFTIGHFDARYKVDPKAIIALPGQPGSDPAGFGVESAYTTAMLDHFYNELGVDMDYKYIPLNIGLPWRSESGRDTDDVSFHIARGLRENKDLRVLQAGGLYDFATPFFATDMALSQIGFDRSRVELTYYEGGHMMYTHQPSLKRLSDNIHKFIKDGEK
nr:hypothetical protein [uncultured Hyphomonas sp.]